MNEILRFKPHLGINEKSHLVIGGADCIELAEKFGTPLYVLDENRVRERYREFYSAFSSLYPKISIKYACKANTSLAVLKILKEEGAGIDVLSNGEIFIALKAGMKGRDIIYTSVNRSAEEFEFALKKGIVINLDSISEAKVLKEASEKTGKTPKISFRVNPAVSPQTHEKLATGLKESKFGVHEESAVEAYKFALENGFKVRGIHMHIGSQITSVKPYAEAVQKLLDLAGKIKKELKIKLDFLDFGGGVGIAYREGQEFITAKELADAIVPIIKSKIEEHRLGEPELFFEPGRYIVGDAGILLARVNAVKRTPYKNFIGIDAGFNTLMRPAMYSAYHEVFIANKMNQTQSGEVFDIAGNICESGDILAKDRALPKPDKGDVIAFLDAGAYGIAMASQYNSRPLPAEVIVKDGKYEIIRERESLKSLIKNQKLPSWLK